MRNGRIKEDGPAYYHIMSRVVDRRRVFDDREKERFKSVLVGDSKGALSTVAAYIDLNAVRGSKAYVEDVFQRQRERFGEKRKTGARKMAGCQWGDLCSVRRLCLEVITPPATC